MIEINKICNSVGNRITRYVIVYKGMYSPALALYNLMFFMFTPGIYAKGYIVFIFPFVHSYVRDSIPFVEYFFQSFTLKFL